MPQVERIEVPVKPEVKYVITLTEEEARELKHYLSDKPASRITAGFYGFLPY